MTWDWLNRKSLLTELRERVSLLEEQLSDAQKRAAEANHNVAEVDQFMAKTAASVAAMHGQVRALRRVVRSGMNRLDRISVATDDEEGRQLECTSEIEKMRQAIRFIECRIDDEAEQTRRGIAALFVRAETNT